MRALVFVISIVSAGVGNSVHAESMSVKTDCDPSLQKRMMADPKAEATCSATVNVNGTSVTKTYHASINLPKDRQTDATLALREVCDSCGTSGPVETRALDFSKLSNWAIAQASKSLAAGEVSTTEEGDEGEEVAPPPSDSCNAKSNSTDRLSCKISKLNNEASVTKMREYYLASVQNEFQKLASSKKDADQALLRQATVTMLTTAGGVTESDLAIKSSVYEFNSFLEMRQLAKLDPSPAYRQMIKTKYETIFRDRPTYNKRNGVESDALDGNSKFLLKLVGEELGGSGAGPAAGSTPRTQFGTPGLQQGRGFTPPAPRSGSPAGANSLDRIFHRN